MHRRTWRGISRLAALATAAVLLAGCSTESTRPDEEGTTATTARTTGELLTRRNVTALTAGDKADLVEAMQRLKTTPSPNGDGVGNWYDHFVAEHVSKLVCWTDEPGQGGYGHNGPDLLTWHRAYLQDFEAAMSTVMGKPMALPYWDWTDPASTEAVFADDFMGPAGDPNQGYALVSGPFRRGEWPVAVKGFAATNPGQADHIVRATGTMGSLPEPGDLAEALTRPEYEVAPWDVTSDDTRSFRAFVDGNVGATGIDCSDGVVEVLDTSHGRLHAAVHMWVGGMTEDGDPGSLADTLTSPNDPIFWLHHANIDRLAESWWAIHDYAYAPNGEGPRGSNADDVMWPYEELTNGDVVRPVSELGYRYDTLIEPAADGGRADGTTTAATATTAAPDHPDHGPP